MKNSAAAALFAALIVSGTCLDAAGQTIRRWVDDEGNVHFGEFVPPEYAHRDREVLNRQGVVVGHEKGELSDEDRAEMQRQADAEEARRSDVEAMARRDKILLDTYLTVEDIEELRDRRLELMESQIKVTEQYLDNLHVRLASLQRESKRYADADIEVPPELTLDISRTTASISLYEENLTRTRAEKEDLDAAFAADISRFIELTGKGKGSASAL